MNCDKHQMQMSNSSTGRKKESVDFTNEQMKQKHKNKRRCWGKKRTMTEVKRSEIKIF